MKHVDAKTKKIETKEQKGLANRSRVFVSEVFFDHEKCRFNREKKSPSEIRFSRQRPN
jgi:hypothetical protein